MRLRRSLRVSARALAAHRLRASLALGCVALGTAGVQLTSALGEGAGAEVERSVQTAGASLLVVRPARVKRSPARRELRGVVSTLRPEDARAIAALPLVVETAGALDLGARLKGGSGSAAASVLGTTPALARVRGYRLRSGRFLDADDDREARRVLVLGDRVARTLFGSEDPVGREVRLRGLPFEVTGVLLPQGVQADGSDQDGTAFVPLRTALRRLSNTTWLTGVFVSVASRDRMAEAEADVRTLLRDSHRLRPGVADDFEVQDQTRLLRLQRQAVRTVTLVASGLAGVSLLLGGSGILALMLLSVKERTAEIGLRLAVGARPQDVLVQFLAEATLLALGGWLLGSATALGAGLVAARATAWTLAFPMGAAVSSLLVVLVTGLGAGALPARRAARLVPLAALRSRS